MMKDVINEMCENVLYQCSGDSQPTEATEENKEDIHFCNQTTTHSDCAVQTRASIVGITAKASFADDQDMDERRKMVRYHLRKVVNGYYSKRKRTKRLSIQNQKLKKSLIKVKGELRASRRVLGESVLLLAETRRVRDQTLDNLCDTCGTMILSIMFAVLSVSMIVLWMDLIYPGYYDMAYGMSLYVMEVIRTTSCDILDLVLPHYVMPIM